MTTRSFSPSMPRSRLAARGRILVRVRAGEAPTHLRSSRDVSAGAAAPATRIDGGPIDAVVRRHSPALLATCAFHAAAHVGRPGQGHCGWDDVEESIGLSRTLGVRVDPAADVHHLVAELAELSSVELASPYYLATAPFASASRRPPRDAGWPHRMIGAAAALAVEPGDPATLIGVVDSGVDLEHAEFAGRLRAGVNAVTLGMSEMPEGMKLVRPPGDRRPDDDQGHGTGCAGIIGAKGVRIPRGVAGDAWIIPIKALCAVLESGEAEPVSVGSLVDIDRAVKTAIDLGARVLNLSFGTPESALSPDDPVPHVHIVEYALARGCVLVAASGNTGDETRYFPAALPGVIAVGAVDAEGRPARFSTRGDHVCVCAPGEEIPMASLDGYTRGDGTSFAAPFVAGACALMIARGLRQSTPLSAETVRGLLASSARPFGAGDARRGHGAGILDMPAALRAVDEACRLAQRGAA